MYLLENLLKVSGKFCKEVQFIVSECAEIGAKNR